MATTQTSLAFKQTKTPSAESPDDVFGVRRAFTLPAKLRDGSPRASEEPSKDDDITELYSLPQVHIISFNPSMYSTISGHSSQAKTTSHILDAMPGTLPWASKFEKTLAYGPLRIYNARHSVTFLSSGSFVHPMMAKTQCWCVDGVSKFVLPMRDGKCCRIELPTVTSSDEERVEEFKALIANIIRFEKTPCPFKRSFEVKLPPEPEHPVKMVPWKARTPIKSPEDISGSLRCTSPLSEPARKYEDVRSYEQLNSPPIFPQNSARTGQNLGNTMPKGKPSEVADRVSGRVKSIKQLLEDASGPNAKLAEPSLHSAKPYLSQIINPEPTKVVSSDDTGDIDVFQDFREPSIPTMNLQFTETETPTEDFNQMLGTQPSSMQRSGTIDSLETTASEDWMTARSHSSSLSMPSDGSGSNNTDESTSTLKNSDAEIEHSLRLHSQRKTIAPDSSDTPTDHCQKLHPSNQKPDPPNDMENLSITTSSDSFQRAYSPLPSLPPSPPDSNHSSPDRKVNIIDHLVVSKRRQVERDMRDGGLLPSPDVSNGRESPASLSHVTASDDSPKSESSAEPHFSSRHTLGASNTRPSADPSSSGPRIGSAIVQSQSRARTHDRNLAATVLQTTWAILNSPPSHLMKLMLTVAKKITEGTLRGSYSVQNEHGEPMSVQWDHTEIDNRSLDWGEDDYGVPIRSPLRRHARMRERDFSGLHL